MIFQANAGDDLGEPGLLDQAEVEHGGDDEDLVAPRLGLLREDAGEIVARRRTVGGPLDSEIGRKARQADPRGQSQAGLERARQALRLPLRRPPVG